jgi:hypothetical protein
MHVTIAVSSNTERGRYLIDCARARDVSVTRFVNKLIERIARDQLVDAVMDDEDEHDRGRHEHRFREVV